MKIDRLAFLHHQSWQDLILETNTIALLLAVGGALLLNTGCSSTDQAGILVDNNNPESVLRAYFTAWEEGDWSLQASLMDEKYAQMVPEPVDSIRIVEIKAIPSSASERAYQVVFEIQVKGKGVSMQSGEYHWTYYLSWDEKRNSWLITNYGAG